MKKIALFIGSLQKGGSERVMVNLAEHFHRSGYRVLLVTQYRREVEYDICGDIERVYSEPAPEKLTNSRIRNFIVRFRTLRAIWKEFQPDVILSFLGKNNMMAVMTSFFLPAKVAVSVRGEPSMEYPGKGMRFLAGFLFRFADGVVLQTQRCLSFFPAGVRKKAAVLPNPLNPAFLGGGFKGGRENVIVSAGRLDENKNHAMLLRAFSRITHEFPEMRLVILGEGEEREHLVKLAEELGIEDKLSMPGSVSNVKEVVGRAKLYALTSNTEGMPNALMEAMAQGTPAVSTDCPCGGPAVLIRDGENGLLVPVGDDEALARAMRRILEDEEFAGKLGKEAFGITKSLAPDKVNREWEQYLKKL